MKCAVAGCDMERAVAKTGYVYYYCTFHKREKDRSDGSRTKPCAVGGCGQPRVVAESGRAYSRCRTHVNEVAYRHSRRLVIDATTGEHVTSAVLYERRKVTDPATGKVRSYGAWKHWQHDQAGAHKCARNECAELNSHLSVYCLAHKTLAVRASSRRLIEDPQKSGRIVPAGLVYSRSNKRLRRGRHYEPMNPWPTECQAAVCLMPSRAIDPGQRHRPGPGRNPLGESDGHEPPLAWARQHPEYDGPFVLRPEHWACNSHKHDRPDWEVPHTNPKP